MEASFLVCKTAIIMIGYKFSSVVPAIVTLVCLFPHSAQSLSEPSNYHEFCRLLLRLKSNYQLGELVLVSEYSSALELIAKFTVESLSTWQFAPNSVHYLLSLWQRMVGSVPYMKVSTNTKFQCFVTLSPIYYIMSPWFLSVFYLFPAYGFDLNSKLYIFFSIDWSICCPSLIFFPPNFFYRKPEARNM